MTFLFTWMKSNCCFWDARGQMENGEPVPLLIAAGGGGKAYLEDPESSLDQIFLEQYENDTSASGVNGKSGAAGTVSLQHSSLQYLLNEKNIMEITSFLY